MKEMRKADQPMDRAGTTGKPPSDGSRRGDTATTHAPRRQAPFRTRLFAMLLLFALIPTIVITLVWTGAASRALSLMSPGSAWERVARSGEAALETARARTLSPTERQVLQAHDNELRQSVELAKRFDFVASRTVRLIVFGALLIVGLVAVGASRVAGHLSRQLSRPLDELVGWTRLVQRGQPLPDHTERRGAPEFEVMRTSMRTMASELETGRKRAIEAERADAFRESARRFAHELKNPLTPIRFAVERLRRSAPDELRETIDVLVEESGRLDAMARSFAQFGRLPDGPAADIDVAELVTKTARSIVPDRLTLTLEIATNLPLVPGYYEPLVRAVANVLINAVEATPDHGEIVVHVSHEPAIPGTSSSVAIVVEDHGAGVPSDVLASMFDPYVTTKPGGTGLGLAIAKQTMVAHGGDISATSSADAGTRLRLRVPVTRTIPSTTT